MKNFNHIIREYLENRAASDGRLAEKMKDPSKSIEKCCLYIVGEAHKKACSAKDGRVAVMGDEEVYGLAVHYFDEEHIEVDPHIGAEVSVSAPDTESESARQRAAEPAAPSKNEEPKKRMASPKRAVENRGVQQLSLFEL